MSRSERVPYFCLFNYLVSPLEDQKNGTSASPHICPGPCVPEIGLSTPSFHTPCLSPAPSCVFKGGAVYYAKPRAMQR